MLKVYRNDVHFEMACGKMTNGIEAKRKTSKGLIPGGFVVLCMLFLNLEKRAFAETVGCKLRQLRLRHQQS